MAAMEERTYDDIDPLKAEKRKPHDDDQRLETETYDIWTVTTAKGKRSVTKDLKHKFDFLFSFAVVRRIFVEVFFIDPVAVTMYVSGDILGAVEESLRLYFSARLLDEMAKLLANEKADMGTMTSMVSLRLGCNVFLRLVKWSQQRYSARLWSGRIRHFEAKFFEARLRRDLPASLNPSRNGEIDEDEIWDAVQGLLRCCLSVVTGASLLLVMFDSSKSVAGVGYLFPVLCMAKPLLTFFGPSLGSWSWPHIIHSDYEAYQRYRGLRGIAETEDYREDIISAGIGEYLIQEFKTACGLLNGVEHLYPWNIYERRGPPFFDILLEISGDLPMIYCILCAVYSPTKSSITSIAILQQSVQSFRDAVSELLGMLEAFGSYVRTVEKYYKELEIPDRDNVLADGQLSYPLPTSSSRGMHFKLRDVCFDYPGGSDQMALRGVNITILPGQLVVIVGVNGSGKSTLIKLLTRLYDPTSGTVSVDGERLSAYRQCTIRQATAVLSQAHRIFPMSMGENIGIGCVERVRDVDAVREAAEDGGASGCIFKLRHGFDTILEPQHRAYGEHISDEEDDPLRQRLGALDKSIQLSGGEKQRIAAARTFMRFKSGKIRAVFVDEPSSALDPEGELRLFDNLRKERQGKTMIFVTHRFGHLTRDADLIICMKDGQVVEQGQHDALMTQNGEYRKLYDIQATAYTGASGADDDFESAEDY